MLAVPCIAVAVTASADLNVELQGCKWARRRPRRQPSSAVCFPTNVSENENLCIVSNR